MKCPRVSRNKSDLGTRTVRAGSLCALLEEERDGTTGDATYAIRPNCIQLGYQTLRPRLRVLPQLGVRNVHYFSEDVVLNILMVIAADAIDMLPFTEGRQTLLLLLCVLLERRKGKAMLRY